MSSSFYRSAPGLAWVAGKLAGPLGHEEGLHVANQVATVVGEAAARSSGMSYDLVNGIVGLTVLARACSPAERDALLDQLWAVLLKSVVPISPGFSWLSGDRSDMGADLGVAHGIPGVLSGFAAAISEGWSRHDVATSLQRGGEWLWSTMEESPDSTLSIPSKLA